MPVPIIIYPAIALLLVFVGPFAFVLDYRAALIPCLINLILGIWMLATTDLFQEMEEASVQYSSGCANITLLYLPMALTCLYAVRLLSFVNRFIRLDVLVGLATALFCAYQGYEGWKAWQVYQGEQGKLEALLAKPVESPGDISMLRSPGESSSFSIPLGCSSMDGLWMFTHRHASLTYQRKGKPWVAELKLHGGQEKLILPRPKARVAPCGDCTVALKIPSDAAPGPATLAVDLSIQRYPRAGDYPEDLRVEKTYSLSVLPAKKVEALKAKMADFTTYERQVKALKALQPEHPSHVKMAIAAGAVSLICWLLVMGRKLSSTSGA